MLPGNVLLAEMLVQAPELTVQIPPNFQPSTARARKPPLFDKNVLPGPIGSSMVPLVRKTCGWFPLTIVYSRWRSTGLAKALRPDDAQPAQGNPRFLLNV